MQLIILKPKTKAMYKLVLFIMLCMWSADSGAHKMGMRENQNLVQPAGLPESLELFNPFLAFSN